MSTSETDRLREMIAAALRAAGTDATNLARDIGRGKDFVRDFMSGKKASMSAPALYAIEQRLGLAAGSLLRESGEAASSRRPGTSFGAEGFGAAGFAESARRPLPPAGEPPLLISGETLVGPRDLPVYAAAMGGRGHEIVTFDPIDFVKRPVVLERVKNAYGILVVSTSMAPMFRQNDIALINPHLAPVADTEVVLYHTPPNGESEAMIKTLTGTSAKEWKLRQYNPPQDFSEDRVDWPICHRVVGKYDRR